MKITLSVCALGSVAEFAPTGFNAGVFDADFHGLSFDVNESTSNGKTIMNLVLLNGTETSGAVCLE